MQESLSQEQFKELIRTGNVSRKPSHVKGEMNKTEQRYAEELALLQRTGEVKWWGFEAITLKLAEDTRYTPDFFVVWASGRMEFVETKGFFRDDALVKVKVAANMFPFFAFTVLFPKKGGWDRREFK